VIRFARAEDLPSIVSLIRGIAAYERLSHEVVLRPEDLGRFLFGEPRYAEVLLAEEGGQVVGFALFFHNFSTFLGRPGLYLEDLFVEPEHRGRGHGRALFAAVARLAVERGCGRMEWAVLDWNTPAIEFYRRAEATPMSDWTVFRLTGEALRRLAESSHEPVSPATGSTSG
jgi:GNAT superfamily N-acetyltransferase